MNYIIDDTSNVGLGITAPSSLIHVTSSVNVTSSVIDLDPDPEGTRILNKGW